MRHPAPSKIVLFADMLGFASLTEQHKLDPEAFRDAMTATDDELYDLIYRHGELNPLAQNFLKFHQIVERNLAEANRSEPHTSVIFSDSVFIAGDWLYSVLDLSIKLMRALIDAHIPVRMGIGYGEFLVVRMSADMSLTGGTHSAQFLGSSVVRAHAAEQCGIKGMRILLHPSVMPLFDKSEEYRPAMLSSFPANKPRR